MTNRFLQWVASALLLATVGGCDLVGPTAQCECRCAPPILLHVTKAGGGPVPSLTVVGASGSCSEEPDANRSSCFVGDGPGTYEFDLQAPGFQTVHISQEVLPETGEGCCECGYLGVILEREMAQ